MRIIVVGGAGYIGSHAALSLREAGHEPFVVDDFSSGHERSIVDGVRYERADVTQPGVLQRLCDQVQPEGLMHFAARIQVGESMARPELYFATNVGAMLRVAEVAARRRFPVVFSSTASVYGNPTTLPIPAEHPCAPQNPYGRSKLICEQILADVATAHGFRYAVLRYFNAAGAAPEHGLRERHEPETHLIPLAVRAAAGGATLKVFGDDWPTRDGTCVRDYVHVLDLAEAHIRALDRLRQGSDSFTVNLGAGVGVTVREVLREVGRAIGRAVPVDIAPRRPGDVAELVADIASARRLLEWSPSRSNIARMVDEVVRSESL